MLVASSIQIANPFKVVVMSVMANLLKNNFRVIFTEKHNIEYRISKDPVRSCQILRAK